MSKQFIFGISSTVLTAEEIALFTKFPPFGFILFSRNVESREQIIALTKSLRDLFPNKAVPIFIDQEGGRVARIQPPIAEQQYKAAKHFGDLYEETPDEAIKITYKNFATLMRELKLLGIDSPNAPNCDILHKNSNNVIGDRSFGSNSDQVIALATTVTQAILDEHGIPVIKHIPGHGPTTLDSHYYLPVVNLPLQELIENDFRVFKELSKKFSEKIWAMTAHVIYTSLDSDQPATLSKIVMDYIRNAIGFKGLVMTDDINMSALYPKDNLGIKYSTLNRIISAINSGEVIPKALEARYHEHFGNEINFADKDILLSVCKDSLAEIKDEFIAQLVDNAELAFKAGCDIVLN
jgi:beta-N-acetylhexosaminidase